MEKRGHAESTYTESLNQHKKRKKEKQSVGTRVQP